MKYYSRIITKRVVINHFGKIGFRSYLEYVKTRDISSFNKGKKIRFYEDENVKKELRHLEANKIYEREVIA